MKTRDELFTLIKSLDKNEKGYFHKFSGLHGNNKSGNYPKLFDFIAAMDQYSDAKVKEAFKDEKFISQLGVTKHYLKNLIIKSLRNYYGDTVPETELLNGAAEISMLIKKQLYDTALRLVYKLKKTAAERDDFLQSVFLLQMEFRILTRQGNYPEISITADARLHNETKYLRLQENACDYRYLQGLVFGIIKTQGYELDNSIKKTTDILNHPLLENEEMALSFYAKNVRLHLLSSCYRKLGDSKKATEAAENLVMLFQSNADKIKLQPYNYFVALNSLISRHSSNRNFAEAMKCISEAEGLLADKDLNYSNSQRFDIAALIQESKLAVSIRTFQFEKGIEADKAFTNLISDKSVRPDFLVVNAFHSAFCYLGLRQYDEALKRVNLLINGEYGNSRKDMVLGAHGMNILIHYNLGNYKLIKRLYIITHNYMTINSFVETGWKAFVKNFNNIIKAAISGNKSELAKQLNVLLLHINEYSFLEVNLMKWWVSDKLKQ